ncbi:MAG: site-specific DNA-methyltransferase [Sulfuricurvum sp.]|nr:site-specific DNA-methyltransferase [Sulfuricurvum sp.]
MEKRLNLAKDLLKATGAIFISIDDNEMAQLKLLCDKIFGEESYVAIFPWKKRSAKSDVPFGISQDYEWILCYAREKFLAGITHERKYYRTDDFPNDGWRLSDLTTQRSAEERPNSAFSMINPKTGKVYPFNPKRTWGVSKDTFQEYYKKNKIVFPDDYEFLKISIPAYRVFESEDKAKALKKYGSTEAIKAISTFLPKEIGMSQDGNKNLIDIFGSKVFSFPKPVSLVSYLLKIINNKNALILDFMAGTGTTGHAVLDLNAQDGGNRRFILCTNNENGICENVTYPRLQKVIQGYQKKGDGDTVNGLGGNLRYFKTSLLKKSKSIKSLKNQLTRECIEMLCVKENIYNLVKETKEYKIFLSNDESRSLCEKILDVYKRLVKLNIPMNPEMLYLDFDKARKRVFEEKDKDDGARLLRVILEKTIEKIASSHGINITEFSELSRLNDHLKQREIFTKVLWEENKTYIAIGNHAAHGDHDEYDYKQVENFYRHIQNLIDTFIG